MPGTADSGTNGINVTPWLLLGCEGRFFSSPEGEGSAASEESSRSVLIIPGVPFVPSSCSDTLILHTPDPISQIGQLLPLRPAQQDPGDPPPSWIVGGGGVIFDWLLCGDRDIHLE
jgi:hypothetical protein